MGVMTCSRKNCDEIMCQTYIESLGYICYNCQSEFSEENSETMTEKEIFKKLKVFMQTEKSALNGTDIIDVYEFFYKRC